MRSSKRAVTWAALEPSVALVDGDRRWRRRTARRRRRPAQVGEERLGGQLGAGSGPGVAGRQDPPVHRHQVGGEEDLGGQVLLDLGRVAVVEEAVGDDVLVDGAERVRRRGRPAGTGDAAGGVDDDAGRLDQVGVEQRGQGQRGGGDVAAGRGHEAGALEVGAVAFGQAVDGFGEERGLVVVEAVPARVERARP